jgi:predicted RNA polymerase sigma factor
MRRARGNRAVAVSLASGPAAGLDLLEPLLGDAALEELERRLRELR